MIIFGGRHPFLNRRNELDQRQMLEPELFFVAPGINQSCGVRCLLAVCKAGGKARLHGHLLGNLNKTVLSYYACHCIRVAHLRLQHKVWVSLVQRLVQHPATNKCTLQVCRATNKFCCKPESHGFRSRRDDPEVLRACKVTALQNLQTCSQVAGKLSPFAGPSASSWLTP